MPSARAAGAAGRNLRKLTQSSPTTMLNDYCSNQAASQRAIWEVYQPSDGPLILLPKASPEPASRQRSSGHPGVDGAPLAPPAASQPSYPAGQRGWDTLATAARFNSEDLAQLCQVSLRTLQRHFTKNYGTPLGEWMRVRRLELAHARIQSGERVKFVAYDLGFKQLSHFSRTFKEHYGATPRALSTYRTLWQ